MSRLKMDPYHEPELPASPPGASCRGLALVWIIVTMVIVSAVGAAMVSLYGSATWSRIGGAGIAEARWMAESGRRFFLKEYRDLDDGTERDRNQLLETLDGQRFEAGAEHRSRFQLDLTSWFYRVETDPAGASTLRVRFPGGEGFDPTSLSSGYLLIDGQSEVYEYTNPPTRIGAGEPYSFDFVLDRAVPSTAVYTGVYPVVKSTIASPGVAEGGTLTLTSGGEVFPEKNGIFVIEKEKILSTLPVSTYVAYRYEYRNGNNLVNVTAGPGQSGFTDIDESPSTSVEIQSGKFFELKSTGAYGADATQSVTYAMAAPSHTSGSGRGKGGLKAFWNFEDVSGTTVADAYGTYDGTIQGSPSVVGGVVGNALAFDPSGDLDYIETIFNPEQDIGNNQPFSISFWARPDTVTDTFSFQVVLGSANTSGASKYFFVGLLRYDAIYGDTDSRWVYGIGNSFPYTVDTDQYPLVREDEWQLVTYVFDQSSVQIYVNGVREYDEPFTGLAELSDLDVFIGALNLNNTVIYPYAGDLDEAAVFGRALDFCEINDIFNVAASLPCSVGCDADLYYSFTGNANDESGTNRDGTPWPVFNGWVVGATLTEDQCGVANQAYAFDGASDYINTNFNANTYIGDGQPFTIALWAYPTDVSGTLKMPIGAINFNSSFPSLTQRLYVGIDNGQWFWGYADDYGDTSLPSANANQWAHIGLVYDGAGGITLYVNGVGTSYTYSGTGNVPNLSLYVGTRNAVNTGPGDFVGTIDEVLIWRDVAQSAGFMEDLYTGTNPER